MKNRGFTLIELLLVIGIMSLLGVAASASYTSLTRGMKYRAAVSDVSSLLRLAKERANIDRHPVVVYCYNVMTKQANSAKNVAGSVVGMATAIRLAGRVSAVDGSPTRKGGFIYDEFADLDLSYEFSDDESEILKTKGHRLYRIDENNPGDIRYSIVSDTVYCNTEYDEDDESGERESKDRAVLFSGGGTSGETNLMMSAFVNLGTSDREPSSWKAGDSYGFVFAETQLPDGIVFSGPIPSSFTDLSTAKTMVFKTTGSTGEASDDSVEIYSTIPGSGGNPVMDERVGEAKSNDD